MARAVRFGLLAALACGAFGIASSQAVAGTEQYCGGNYLPPGWSCAGADSHYGLLYTEVTLDHTGCAGLAKGYGGWNSNPNWGNNTWSIACTAGAGTNGGCSGYDPPYHGSANNLNQTTYDYIYQAHVSWDVCP